MKRLRLLFRMIHINFVLVKYGLDQIVLSIPVFAPIYFLSYLNPWRWLYAKDKSLGEKIRLALIELGPIFVKFGQTLSTRNDLFSDDIIHQLSQLQDRVPPFSSQQAIKIIEAQYQKPIYETFAYFNPEAKASASIAQVHEVELPTGKRAIIKILRPNIEKIINRDIALLYTLAKLAEKYWSQGKRLRPIEVVKEFDKIIHDELDLMREAANASQLRRNFLHSAQLYIPEIYWPYVRDRVMVMEYISGIPIADIEALKAHKINLKKLAELGVEIFFTQVFRDSFFHADMHPGNIFVNPDRPEDPQYLAVDFGIMGSLNPADQHYLAFNILAFFHRDYRKIAELHVESGWVAEDTRIDEFESAIRTVCEPIFEKPLKEISFGRTLMRLFQTGRRFNMQVQPQLVLLQKTLLHIEGLGRKLYPDLDLWQTAKPYLENWVRQQTGLGALFKKSYANFPYWTEQMPEIPTLTYEALQAIKILAKSAVRKKTSPPEKVFTKIKRVRFQSLFTGLGLGLALAAIYDYSVSRAESNFNWHSILILGTSAIIMLVLALLFSMED